MLSVKQNFGVLYTKGAPSGAIAAYRSAESKGERFYALLALIAEAGTGR
jgi:hypothetical protein